MVFYILAKKTDQKQAKIVDWEVLECRNRYVTPTRSNRVYTAENATKFTERSSGLLANVEFLSEDGDFSLSKDWKYSKTNFASPAFKAMHLSESATS